MTELKKIELLYFIDIDDNDLIEEATMDIEGENLIIKKGDETLKTYALKTINRQDDHGNPTGVIEISEGGHKSRGAVFQFKGKDTGEIDAMVSKIGRIIADSGARMKATRKKKSKLSRGAKNKKKI